MLEVVGGVVVNKLLIVSAQKQVGEVAVAEAQDAPYPIMQAEKQQITPFVLLA